MFLDFEMMTEVSINKDMRLSKHLASPSEAALSHASKLDGIRLSPHFTLGELTKTSFKTEDGNIPSRVAIENLHNLCENWLEDLRYSYNRLYHKISPCASLSRDDTSPLIINSGYRSPEVNRLAGGAPTSNHVTGCAVDIHVDCMEQLIRYATILLDLSDESQEDFDELLLERSPKGGYWLHFAVRPSGNRRKIRLIQT